MNGLGTWSRLSPLGLTVARDISRYYKSHKQSFLIIYIWNTYEKIRLVTKNRVIIDYNSYFGIINSFFRGKKPRGTSVLLKKIELSRLWIINTNEVGLQNLTCPRNVIIVHSTSTNPSLFFNSKPLKIIVKNSLSSSNQVNFIRILTSAVKKTSLWICPILSEPELFYWYWTKKIIKFLQLYWYAFFCKVWYLIHY